MDIREPSPECSRSGNRGPLPVSREGPGTHAELLARDGLYRQLISAQLEGHRVDVAVDLGELRRLDDALERDGRILRVAS